MDSTLTGIYFILCCDFLKPLDVNLGLKCKFHLIVKNSKEAQCYILTQVKQHPACLKYRMHPKDKAGNAFSLSVHRGVPLVSGFKSFPGGHSQVPGPFLGYPSHTCSQGYPSRGTPKDRETGYPQGQGKGTPRIGEGYP